MPRAAQLVAALAVVGTAAAGKFDKYKTCEACIEAGWGWNTKKGKCGAFPNKSCGNAAATAPVPPYNGEPVGLTDANFDAFVKSSDIVVVEFYAPWCGHCKKLEPIYAAAARALHSSMKNVKFAKVDSTDEACAETKAKYEVTGFPMTFMFRSGEKQYKILEEVSDRNVERISHLVKFESSQPAPPPPGAPIFLKFDLEGSSKLMEHKIKSQIAFFYSSVRLLSAGRWPLALGCLLRLLSRVREPAHCNLPFPRLRPSQLLWHGDENNAATLGCRANPSRSSGSTRSRKQQRSMLARSLRCMSTSMTRRIRERKFSTSIVHRNHRPHVRARWCCASRIVGLAVWVSDDVACVCARGAARCLGASTSTQASHRACGWRRSIRPVAAAEWKYSCLIPR
jgi:protein disulfide-isomerase-like protein|eukprot:SAG25_NODE_74_length_16997_cov_287.503166_4_plen_396_part_00